MIRCLETTRYFRVLLYIDLMPLGVPERANLWLPRASKSFQELPLLKSNERGAVFFRS